MEALNRIQGIAALMERTNVDTDQIIPKQFLKAIGKSGFGKYLFNDWRYLEDGTANPNFELNRLEFQGANILVAGDNFGCGSSREHAPWALQQYGFKVIISTSYADIFFNNCYKNGMLPIIVSYKELENLMQEIRLNPGVAFEVDVPTQELTTPGNIHINFDVDQFRKGFLLKGMDDIGWSLQYEDEIKKYEKKQQLERPWLWSN